MTRKIYPSDISRAQFEVIRGLLENAKKKTCPREVDLYDIFCAILYLLKEGCRWRALPGDFPPRSTVRYYFDRGRLANGAPEARTSNQACWSRH